MEASATVENRDFLEGIQGKLLIEIGELDSFSKADARRVKRIITCRTDRFRKPYGRATNDFPRQSIFVGTTNEKHYLVDDTGSRRFWPLRCGKIHLETLRADREQLFAEAVARYLDNEDWWKLPEEQARQEQEDRRQFDEWENLISEYLRSSCLLEISLSELGTVVGIDKAHLDMQVQRRLGSILRRIGWESRTLRRDSVILRRWVNATQYHEPAAVLSSHETAETSRPASA